MKKMKKVCKNSDLMKPGITALPVKKALKKVVSRQIKNFLGQSRQKFRDFKKWLNSRSKLPFLTEN